MNPEACGRFIEALRPAFQAHDAGAGAKTVESAHVARVEAAYRTILARDWSEFRELLSEDVELEFAGPEGTPIAGCWRGRDEVVVATVRNYCQLEDQRPELLAVLAQGACVAVIGREKGRLRATGRTYDIPWMHLFTLRDGKIARIYGFCDTHAMMETATP